MRALLSLLLFALALWPHASHAQVRKCISADGRPLYTDQKCEALGATEPQAPPTLNAGAAKDVARSNRLYMGGCTRTLQDLVFELRTAIEQGDANRLSSIYHWVDVSDATAVSVMDRLDRIAHRPLLDIQPISADPESESTITGEAGEVPRTTARRPPIGLRLEQTLPQSITPARTVLGLRRYYGCWWVTL
ncbi:hypothetical protein [Noviluteimonas dokdonensis]|nr:hypothetical protein [Lysobacter dokdonensis]